MTKDQLKEQLDALGVEYSEDAKKDELKALLAEHAPEDEAEEAEEVEESEEEAPEEPEEASNEVPTGDLVATRNIKANGSRFAAGDIYNGPEHLKAELLACGALKEA